MVGNKSINKFQIPMLAILVFFVMISATWAANYYVDPNGNNGNPGTLANPWRTITKANNTLTAGDTVYIRQGTYTGQLISPSNSGTVSNRIVYTNYNGETVTISQSEEPIILINRSYVTVNGITATDCDKYLSMENGHYNIISYCTITDMRNYERYFGFRISVNSSYNWIHHNTIAEYGIAGSTADMVTIGGPNNNGGSHHNLMEDNHFYYGGHNVIQVQNADYNVVRNNLIHNEKWGTWGKRIGEIREDSNSENYGWNLIEGNRFAATDPSSSRARSPSIKICSSNNIFRRNMIYNTSGPGLLIATNSGEGYYNSRRNHIYNNIIFYCRDGFPPISYNPSGNSIVNNVFKNNIFYQNAANGYTHNGNTYENNWPNNNGDPNFVDANIALLNPADINYPDFHLQSNSQAINGGAFLTTTTSSGSGTAITVDDANYFFDGWGIAANIPGSVVPGDLIQLEGQTQRARITNVNYNTNTITVDTPLSWNNGQGVSLAYEGSAPDMGAFESGVDNPPSDNEVPTIPGNLQATTISASQIDLSWNASTDNVGVTGYNIYRDGAQIASTGNTTYQDTGLSPSTTYNYTVSAYDAAGNESGQSISVSATTQSPDNEIPTIPANLQATTISASQINLSWNASTDNVGVTGYRIYRGGTQIASTANTTYQDTGLSPSTTYDYTVSAYDAAGNESGQSISVSATTQSPDNEIPTIPANLQATAISSLQVDLSWDASTDNVGVTGYNIYRGGTQIASTANTTYQDTGLSPSTTYDYTVSAYDAAGNESGQSISVSATTQFPDADYTILKTSTPPIIDGDPSEFQGANEIQITSSNGGNVGRYKLLWDEMALYICAQVTDANLNADYSIRDEQLWTDDSIEVLFDTQNNGGASQDFNDYKLFVNVQNTQRDSNALNVSWDSAFTSSVIASTTINNNNDTDTDYTIEMKITWSDWGISAPSDGTLWGFDLKMNDKDSSATYSEAWFNTNGGSINDPNGWGDIVYSSQTVSTSDTVPPIPPQGLGFIVQ